MKNIIRLTALLSFLIIGYVNNEASVRHSTRVRFDGQQTGSVINKNSSGRDTGSVRETRKKPTEPYTAVVLPSQEDVAEKIRKVFTEEPEKAVAVFRAESGLRPNAKGYNCHYQTSDGTTYSAACKPEDRDEAWSVDCGIAQLNFPGKECPTESLDPEWNINKAHEWKYLSNKKAGGTGWGPWVAESLGRHLVFLTKEK